MVAITGASSGIGKAIALLLAANGAKALIGARREDQLQELVKSIKDYDVEAVYKVADVKQRNNLNALAVAFAIGQPL